MKMAKVNITGIQIKEIETNFHQHVKRIDGVENKESAAYIVEFKGLDTPGLIIRKDNEYMGIHTCEQNERGSSCKHLSILAAVVHKVGGNLQKFSVKTSLKEHEEREEQLRALLMVNMNSAFGLIVPVEEPEETEEPTVTSAPEPSVVVDKEAPTTDWKKDWNSIQNYLDEANLSPALIAKIQERRERVFETVSYRSNMIAPSKPHFPYEGEMLARSLRHVLLNKHLILIGGKGSGKDTLINTISWVFGLPMTIQVGSKDETKESIVGEPAFRSGESTFDLSPLALTVGGGGIVNMAEVNMLSGDVTSVYHSLLDENGVLATPIGAINHHENFLMIATMNVGEGYTGVRPLNDAFKDRFAILRLPYVSDFKKMLSAKTGLHDNAGLLFLEKVKGAVDQLIQEESQGHAANTIRGYIDAAKYFLMVGITRDTRVEVIEDYILNKIEDLDEYMALRDMIRASAWRDFPISPEEKKYMEGDM